MHRSIISLFLGLILLFTGSSCLVEPTSDTIVYNNLSIYSDISNRLDHAPNDSIIIEQLIQYFIEDCVKPGIKINDRSAISFSKLNNFNSNCRRGRVDLNNFKENLNDKQQFVNNTSSTNLNTAIDELRESILCSYKERDLRGLDIVSLLRHEIANGLCNKDSKTIITQYDTTYLNYENHLFLFTDGYLEFRKKGADSDFYFGYKEIDRIRRRMKKTGETDITEFLIAHPEYSIPFVDHSNAKDIHLYVLETYDRGINKKYGTIKNAGPLSDNNILKHVWEFWAENSGFKSFTWRMITNKNSLPQDYVKNMVDSNM